MNERLEIPTNEVAEFCQRNHIRRLALFGSVLRDDFTPESDVDVLVEFDPSVRSGYFAMAGLEIELGEILGRKADLLIFKGVESNPNWLLREEILGTAEAVYEQAG